MNRQVIFKSTDRIPLNIINEIFYQNSIQDKKADSFVKKNYNKLHQHINPENIIVNTQLNTNKAAFNGNYQDTYMMNQSNNINQAIHTVRFTLEDEETQYVASLKGRDSSILKHIAIKIQLNPVNSKIEANMLPAYQIFSSIEASIVQNKVQYAKQGEKIKSPKQFKQLHTSPVWKLSGNLNVSENLADKSIKSPIKEFKYKPFVFRAKSLDSAANTIPVVKNEDYSVVDISSSNDNSDAQNNSDNNNNESNQNSDEGQAQNNNEYVISISTSPNILSSPVNPSNQSVNPSNQHVNKSVNLCVNKSVNTLSTTNQQTIPVQNATIVQKQTRSVVNNIKYQPIYFKSIQPNPQQTAQINEPKQTNSELKSASPNQITIQTKHKEPEKIKFFNGEGNTKYKPFAKKEDKEK
ncbi:Hypothetical_protein [Hexamita inflata]|uniref:Hypothetical_protein n=1 Tax=Hexamita inflata TaxID=28002 RepID=A0AA86PHT5_9EUKA|nr:Hypothetical protein HINF_LOCUS23782 [Hexamita inflata]